MKTNSNLIKIGFLLIFMLLISIALFQSIINSSYLISGIIGVLLIAIFLVKRNFSLKFFLSVCVIGISAQSISHLNVTNLLPFLQIAGKTIPIIAFFTLMLILLLIVSIKSINEICKLFDNSYWGILALTSGIFIFPAVVTQWDNLNIGIFLIGLQYLFFLIGLAYYIKVYVTNIQNKIY